MLKHYDITVIGRVQGVFFRQQANLQAQALGLTGFVQNKVNGSVYLEIEGEKKLVKQFIDWCYQGSPEAQIEAVEVKSSKLKNFSKFEIKY